MHDIASIDYIILVAGVPGTGKTTIGKMLSQELPCAFHDSSRLFKSLGLVEQDPTGRDTGIVSYDAIDKAIKALSSGCHIVETVYPDLWIDSLYELIPFVAYLRTHPRVLCSRLKTRKWREAKVLENCAAEALNTIGDLLYQHSDMVVEVDTTGLKPVESLEVLWGKLESWDVGLRIDWLQEDPSLVDDVSRWLSTIDVHGYGKPY